MILGSQMKKARTAMKVGLGITHEALMLGATRGDLIFDMRDTQSGETLVYWEKKNVITRDAGILAARLFRNSLDPSAAQNNGLVMLGVGTGATGNLLSPDAPQATQRKLNTEIARKAFSSAQYRNTSGVAVAFPTNIVDFTTVYGEAEAVGPLNEMGLMSTASVNPATLNPINNGPTGYDATIDVTGKDLMVNYLTFSVVTKPATATLAITWRLTF
jgi:hypothetical protein